MKSTFKSSINKFAAKVRNNINDLRELNTDRKRERTAKHYETADKHPEPVTVAHTGRNSRQRALAKHTRQIAREKRRQNRHQGKGNKVEGRGH